MQNESSPALTDLLGRWRAGDPAVEQELMSRVYPVLRELAAAQARRNSGVLTLQATELAHEAYERLVRLDQMDWTDRNHFYAVAATVIRRVVVDHLRVKGRVKRGGSLPLVALHELSEDQVPVIEESVDWLSIDEAMESLAQLDRDCARVVELKFFSGLTTDKIAEVLGSSVATVGRQWRFSRAWLGKQLGAEPSAA
ncbi:MAG: sigma-70 family RNA polymerase sigma factor [Xanthomonadales bacterium]|nr:sigma-70 family RNA polymerase sigma factor [Xanthomonadales bacterium]